MNMLLRMNCSNGTSLCGTDSGPGTRQHLNQEMSLLSRAVVDRNRTNPTPKM